MPQIPDLDTLFINPDPSKAAHYVGSFLVPAQTPLGMVRWEGSDPGALIVTLRTEGAFWAQAIGAQITPLPLGTDHLWLHRIADLRGRNLEEMTGLSEAATDTFAAMWEGEKPLSSQVIKRLIRAFHLAQV